MQNYEKINTIRKAYIEKKNRLDEKYRVRYADGMPKIDLYINTAFDHSDKATVTINWGSCGEQSIEFTIEFQQYLKEVVALADKARLELATNKLLYAL